MNKVIIIKNNDITNQIHQNAKASYDKGKKGSYYAIEGTKNENAIKAIKKRICIQDDILVFLITYSKLNSKQIEDVYIGTDVKISDNNIEYLMKVYMDAKNQERAIESIINKIDLNVDEDYPGREYVMESRMNNLYVELKERINACEAQEPIKASEGAEVTGENYCLDKLAQKNKQALRVYSNGTVETDRTEFQRDRERVVNCKAFRRLVDKAQIFGAEKGDYFRTRMTHSLEVNQIAKAIAYALNLNLDLTEAIALGHDLGHTPFGHEGERTLDAILSGKIDVGIQTSPELFARRCFGGFKHNYQSARVLTEIEEKYVGFSGLNVSVQVIEGVLKHTELRPKKIELKDFIPEVYLDKIVIDNTKEMQVCSSLEGQVVAIADEIAQRGHDVDDALTSGVMSIEEFVDMLKIPKCKLLHDEIQNEIRDIRTSKRLIVDRDELLVARIVSLIVKIFINSTITNSKKLISHNKDIEKITYDNQIKMIDFEPDMVKVNRYLEKVVQKKVICNTEVARADYNASMVVSALFKKYYKNPRLLHKGTIHKIFIETLKHENKAVASSAINFGDSDVKLVDQEIKEIAMSPLDTGIIISYLENKTGTSSTPEIVKHEKRKILIRAITDYIAGMTDGYALEEYEKLK